MKENKKIMVELYTLGELPRKWENSMNKTILEQEKKIIIKSDQEILDQYKPSAMARIIEDKRNHRGTDRAGNNPKWAVPGYLTALAAALVVMFLLIPNFREQEGTYGPEELTRIKGSEPSALSLYRRAGDTTEKLDSESSAKEGDLLQLGYRVAPGQDYGIIISVDGRGVVTRHFAPEGELTEKLASSGEQLLPYSYELDNAPRFETFYLIVSDKPFPVDPVVDMTAREARKNHEILNIPEIISRSSLDPQGLGTFTQYALTIRKEE